MLNPQPIQPQTFGASELVSYRALLCPAISCPAISCPVIKFWSVIFTSSIFSAPVHFATNNNPTSVHQLELKWRPFYSVDLEGGIPGSLRLRRHTERRRASEREGSRAHCWRTCPVERTDCWRWRSGQCSCFSIDPTETRSLRNQLCRICTRIITLFSATESHFTSDVGRFLLQVDISAQGFYALTALQARINSHKFCR